MKCYHGPDPGQRLGLRRVHPDDFGMGVGATERLAVQHAARQNTVSGKVCLAGNFLSGIDTSY